MSPARSWLLGGCFLALACGETASSPDGSGGSGGASAGSSAAGTASSDGHAGQASGGSSAAGTTSGGTSSSGGQDDAGSAGAAAGTASGGAAAGTTSGGASSGGTPSGGASGLVDCDPQKVLCKIVQPECPQGEVPSVKGNCYGDCVKIDRCSCTSAAQCPQPDQFTCLKGPMHCSYFLK